LNIENKEKHIENLSKNELVLFAKSERAINVKTTTELTIAKEEIERSKEEIERSNLEIEKSNLEIERSKEEIKKAKEEIAVLKFQLEQFRRAMFGSKAERFVSDKNQLSLPFDLDERAIEQAVETEKIKLNFERKKAVKKQHFGRVAIPENYPRIDIIVAPDFDTTGMTIIGQEITEEIDLTPAKLIVNRYIRNKYISKKQADGSQFSKIASLDFRPIPKCMAGVELLTDLTVSKYVDHLPIYRQISIFKRLGFDIPSSTIESWVCLTASLLQPLYAAHRLSVLGNGYLQVDESPIKVQDKTKDKNMHSGFMWVYHAPVQKGVLFEYHPTRGADAIKDTLSDFKGYLQTDGYGVYVKIGQKTTVTHLGCWAHVRRKFEKALVFDKVRASVVMEYIQQLYEVEAYIREEDLPYQAAKNLRIENSLVVINQIGKYITNINKSILPKSPLGEAINYALNRWDSLLNYLHDGQLQIDNNLVENAIRPLALGRKNYLFAGSHDAAKNIAMYYSFFATCKKHEINTSKWLSYVLRNINETKSNQIWRLLPQHIDKILLS